MEIDHIHPQVIKPEIQFQELNEGGALSELKTRKKMEIVPWYEEEKIWCGTIRDPAISEAGSAKGIEKSSIQLQE